MIDRALRMYANLYGVSLREGESEDRLRQRVSDRIREVNGACELKHIHGPCEHRSVTCRREGWVQCNRCHADVSDFVRPDRNHFNVSRAQAFVLWKDGESSEVAALRTGPGVYSVHLPSSRTSWEIAQLLVSVLDSGEDIERCELHFDAPSAEENLFARTVREQLEKAAAAGLVEPPRCECGSGVHKPGPGHSSYCKLLRPA
jgi:hypothetical protein